MEQRQVFRLQLFAVLTGVLILLAKFSAYYLTGSNTIFTDALESIVNVVAGTFALYSLYLSAKPRDADHPYGHGKAAFLSAGFEGAMILVAGLCVVVKSSIALLQPAAVQHIDSGIYIVAASGFFNFILGYLLIKKGKQSNSLILVADGEHLKTDAYSSAGILIGLLLIYLTGWTVLDSIFAIIFGFLIAFTGFKLMRKSVAGIMDEADEKIITDIITLLNAKRKAQWIDVHNLRVIQYGSLLHIDCHVTIPWYFTLEEAHAEIEEIAALVNREHAAQIEFFIHADPCIPESCKICLISNCPKRKNAFVQKWDWQLDNIIKNQKHGLSL